MRIADKMQVIWNVILGRPVAYKIQIKDGMIVSGLVIDVHILDGEDVINRLLENQMERGGGIVRIRPGIYEIGKQQ
jgi:hypothetical protein